MAIVAGDGWVGVGDGHQLVGGKGRVDVDLGIQGSAAVLSRVAAAGHVAHGARARRVPRGQLDAALARVGPESGELVPEAAAGSGAAQRRHRVVGGRAGVEAGEAAGGARGVVAERAEAEEDPRVDEEVGKSAQADEIIGAASIEFGGQRTEEPLGFDKAEEADGGHEGLSWPEPHGDGGR